MVIRKCSRLFDGWSEGQRQVYVAATLLIPPSQQKRFLDDQVNLRSSVPHAQALHRLWSFPQYNLHIFNHAGP